MPNHVPVGRPIRRAKIASLATFVPPRVLTNADLERMVETNDAWIVQRTGIRQRHIAEPGVATSDLARSASIEALARAGLTPDDVELIVFGTTTADTIFPSSACNLQMKIGAPHAWGFDLGAACSGFTYALTAAAQMVSAGAHDCALAVGADVMSSIIDYTDRSTCILFGDGAGVVVVVPSDEPELGIIDFAHEIDGSGGPSLMMPAGGSKLPASHETIDQRLHYVKQDGMTVFKFAVRKTEEICRRLLDKNGLGPEDIDLFVSHQANRRIIEAAAKHLGLDDDKVIINIDEYGNTTAATIPLALADAIACGRLKKGDLVVLTSVGAGFTVGSVLLRWAYSTQRRPAGHPLAMGLVADRPVRLRAIPGSTARGSDGSGRADRPVVSVLDDFPADARRRAPENDEHASVAWRPGLFAVADDDTASAVAEQRRRGRAESGRAACAQATRVRLARSITVAIAGGDVGRQADARGRSVDDVHRPYGTPDGREVRGVADLFVTDQLGPCAIRCVGEIVSRSVAVRVPASGGLARRLPQRNGKRGSDLTEGDHEAVSVTSDAASARTSCGPVSSGSQSPASTSAGRLPLSAVRGRSNHRLTPMSL